MARPKNPSSALSGELAALKSQVAILDAQRARMGRMAEMMNALSDLSAQINTLDASRIKDLCVYRVPALVKARQAAFFTYDAGELILERHTDPRLMEGAKPLKPAEDPLLQRAAASQEALIVLDPAGGLPLCPALAGTERACLLAPLRSSQALVGILVLMDKTDGAVFDTISDLPPLQQLSQLLGAALRNIQLYQQVIQQSRTDSLTGLLNRRALWEQLEREIGRCRRYGHTLSLLMIDLDRFKEVNDAGGHQEGDAVLAGAAGILQSQLRKVDVAARYGGDEFCVILPETPAEGARVVGKRILEALRAWATPAGSRATASIGIASLTGATSPQELVAAADKALYAAKAAGRDGLAVA